MNDRMSSILVEKDATIKQALRAIDVGGIEISLIVDGEGGLLGTVTDGDIRRALLSGAQLEDEVVPYATPNPVVVGQDSSRADVLDLMRARRLSQIPVLDQSGQLVGLHVMQDLLGGIDRPNWAVIMAGGRGARLGDITQDVPKPMVKVAGRPILERIILHLVGSGIRSIFISVNYMAEVIESHFGSGAEYGCRIEYLREEEPLGTGGSLGLLAPAGFEPADPVLVMNGDLVSDFSLDGILGAHLASRAMATVAVHEYTHTVPFGVAATSDNRLLRIEEKPVERWLVNAGIYVLAPELIARVEADRPLDVTRLIQDTVDNDEPVSVWRVSGDWHDIGRPQDLSHVRGER